MRRKIAVALLACASIAKAAVAQSSAGDAPSADVEFESILVELQRELFDEFRAFEAPGRPAGHRERWPTIEDRRWITHPEALRSHVDRWSGPQLRLVLDHATDPDEARLAAMRARFERLRTRFETAMQPWHVYERSRFGEGDGATEGSRRLIAVPIAEQPAPAWIALWLRCCWPWKEPGDFLWTVELEGRTTRFGSNLEELRECAPPSVPGQDVFWRWADRSLRPTDCVLGLDGAGLQLGGTRAEFLRGQPGRHSAPLLIVRDRRFVLLTAELSGSGPGWVQPLATRAFDSVAKDPQRWVIEAKNALSGLQRIPAQTLRCVLGSWVDGRRNGFAEWRRGAVSIDNAWPMRLNPLAADESGRWQRVRVEDGAVFAELVLGPEAFVDASWIRAARAVFDGAFPDDPRAEALELVGTAFAGNFDTVVRVRATPEAGAALIAEAGPELVPIDGDCQDGIGTARHRSLRYEHRGRWKSGLENGPGRRAYLDTGDVLVAMFRDGVPHGPAVCVRGGLRVERCEYSNGAPGPSLPMPYRIVDGRARSLEGFEDGPLVLERGALREGEPANGRCRVEFAGLGTYVGTFVDGIAQGEGVLERADGGRQKLDCFHGVPALVRTLVWTGDERLEAFRRGPAAAFPLGECLRGNAVDGNGTALMSIVDGAPQVYEGEFQDGLPHGKGLLDCGRFAYGGRFIAGAMDGPIQISRGPSVLAGTVEYYERGVRVPPPVVKVASGNAAPLFEFPKSRRVVRECAKCDGHGGEMVDEIAYTDVTINPIMPGQRHFGSWLWTHYAVHSDVMTYQKVGERFQRCYDCDGTGTIVTRL
jgi:hypothetical protein